MASLDGNLLYPDMVPKLGIVERDGMDLYDEGAPIPVPTTYYNLAAIDSGSGRRSWVSTSISFVDAPSPVGTWDLVTLTVLAKWKS